MRQVASACPGPQQTCSGVPALPTSLAEGAAPSDHVCTTCSLLNRQEIDKIPNLKTSSSPANQSPIRFFFSQEFRPS